MTILPDNINVRIRAGRLDSRVKRIGFSEGPPQYITRGNFVIDLDSLLTSHSIGHIPERRNVSQTDAEGLDRTISNHWELCDLRDP